MANEDLKITLRLTFDPITHQVIFGESRKDFVDFMFNLLTLPLDSAFKLFSPRAMNGSIGEVYESLKNINKTCLVEKINNSSLLQPKVSTVEVASPLLLDTTEATKEPNYSTTTNVCPHSGSASSSIITENEVEDIKERITYMITDSLKVIPMAGIDSCRLISLLSIIRIGQLDEKVVTVSMKEGLALLKASLDSSTVLTDVFLSSS